MKLLVTGAGGLIGSEACIYWLEKGASVLGIDNNMRSYFFGPGGDTSSTVARLSKYKKYTHYSVDIRSRMEIQEIIRKECPDAIIHAAAQPSHDKAASIPYEDFDVNASGTLNLLESTRKFCPKSIFIHVSTNKVYGDRPNHLPIKEYSTRYDYDGIAEGLTFEGISEKLSIDQSLHSLFGASKTAADIYAQEYGRYFDMNVGIFRGGCLTGPQHAGVELHGFLSYIVKCAVSGNPYTVFGYKGKQVRDQIHCSDVISAFEMFIDNPKKGEVYNIGGCKQNSASILEVIKLLEDDHSLRLNYKLSDENRSGDHICYYTDMSKFKKDYPKWKIKVSLKDIIKEIVSANRRNK